MAAFTYSGKVRWSETDASGLYHYSSALLWAENAEHEFYGSIVPSFAVDNLPRRAISATYNAPFRAGETYEIKLWVQKIGTSSISFAWNIRNGDTIAVEGQHTVIHLGSDFRPSAIPDQLRAGLEPFQRVADE